MNVETVCTHDQLAEFVLGAAALANVLPKHLNGSSAAPREEALRLTLKALSRRSPPIREEDIEDPTELRDAVAYGALEIVYEAAMTTAGPESVFATRWRSFRDKFKAELQGLSPTTGGGATAPPGLGIVMERR